METKRGIANMFIFKQWSKRLPLILIILFCPSLAHVKNKLVQKYLKGLYIPVTSQNVGYKDEKGLVVIPPTYEEISGFYEGFTRARKNGLYGYIDDKGREITDFVYWYADDFHNGMAKVGNENGFGFISAQGKEVIKLEYEDCGLFCEGLAWVKIATKYGYMNQTGEVIIPPRFDSVKEFSSGLAAAKKGNRWGYIDVKGNWVIMPKYVDAGPFNGELGCVKVQTYSESTGYIFINKKGKVILNTRAYLSGEFPEVTGGYVRFFYKHEGGGETIVNMKGIVVYSSQFDDNGDEIPIKGHRPAVFNGSNNISEMENRKKGIAEGQSFAEVYNIKQNMVEHREYKKCVLPMDINGNFPAHNQEYALIKEGEYLYSKNDGIVIAYGDRTLDGSNGDYCTWYRDGIFVFKYGEKLLNYFNEKSEPILSPNSLARDSFDDGLFFENGLAPVKKNGLWGYIDKKGTIVIPLKYETASPFYDNIAVVSVPQKETGMKEFTLIDRNSTVISRIEAYRIGDFSEGIASAQFENGTGYIDVTGKIVIPARMGVYSDHVRPFSEGLAAMRVENRWGYIDKNGNWAIEPRYEFASDFHNGIAAVCLKDSHEERMGIINRSGKMIVKPIYPRGNLLLVNGVAAFTLGSVGFGGISMYLDEKGKPIYVNRDMR